MKPLDSIDRRTFIKNSALAGAGLMLATNRAPAAVEQTGRNNAIRVACIGVGTQGHRLLQAAQNVPGTEISVICDLYAGNIARAKELCLNKDVRIVKEWEKVVADPSIDAVIIAVPDFWHAPITVAAANAKKDIYVEKGWCKTLPEAKQMREAVKRNKVVMQLGHHMNSIPQMHKALEIYKSGALGKVPLVRGYIDRTNEHPEWKFYTDYGIQEMPKDASPETIDWKRFVANSPHPDQPFDAERFFTWRRYWDFGTGIAGDLLTHIWDAINMVRGMGIPESAVTQGGKYFWKEDREVPDMWHVLFDYPKQELAVTFNCSFHNKHVGELIQFLGRDMTMECSSEFCRTYIADWKPEAEQRVMQGRRLAAETRKAAEALGIQAPPTAVAPDYVFRPGELKVTSHMQNFFDCVRSRELPRCHVDRAFEEAVALVMSVESYRREAKVKWDPVKEEIV
ncbi:Gfo/Idh/MocA family protein [Opitutus terrae]|uniref:Oxidoreductase domain protein n=1 Tax=Opitutus terrae (strain DSM 11246 / JCM 15787 / PB90-1) TaxID=452637 RepID=B1ZQ67_OPITP|nr:Gfo/Idh/MocA family oxidoreductase [Opitutus terrae]ACB77788.1 oxidoreductase domain protein [Opitutus terrae PB90-1]